MGASRVAETIDYLRGLAPDFFGKRIRPATDADIARLEHAARQPMSEGHRAFLRAMGNTPATVLNPFLHDQDFSIDALVSEYEELREMGIENQQGTVYFSASNVSGATIFLRHGATLSDDPEVGSVSSTDEKFTPYPEGYFEPFLERAAFVFRSWQLEYALHLAPSFNKKTRSFEGHPKQCREALDELDFPVVFAGPSVECREKDDIAVLLHGDGSMLIYGDDHGELDRVAMGILKHTWMSIQPHGIRKKAPRDES